SRAAPIVLFPEAGRPVSHTVAPRTPSRWARSARDTRPSLQTTFPALAVRSIAIHAISSRLLPRLHPPNPSTPPPPPPPPAPHPPPVSLLGRADPHHPRDGGMLRAAGDAVLRR